MICVYSDSFESVDLGLRCLRYILEALESQNLNNQKSLHQLVPVALPALFETFTNESIGIPERE